MSRFVHNGRFATVPPRFESKRYHLSPARREAIYGPVHDQFCRCVSCKPSLVKRSLLSRIVGDR